MAQKRQTAFRISIKDILKCRMVDGEEWQPKSVLFGDRRVSRASIIGSVVSIDEQTFVVDDGTEAITARASEMQEAKTDEINIGDVVMLIGKIRFFNEERYLAPEIIKKVDEKVVLLRRLELEKEALTRKDMPEVREEIIVAEDDLTRAMQIRSIIKEIDLKNDGKGADIGEISNKSGVAQVEDVISKLLEVGEIFEIRPGKLKVLE